MAIKSPLHDIHENLGAKFTDFAGFNMPIFYSSIKDEHLAVRKNVGLFDVSHMSNLWITGEEACDLLTLCTVEDASKYDIGKSQYTEILREDGTVIDDTIFMNVEKDKYMIIPNAGMNKTVTDWLNKKSEEHDICAEVLDESREYVILAIQGPKSRDLLQKFTDVDLKTVGFFANRYIEINGIECIISHTGYTGELGFELQIKPADNAKDLFTRILDEGKEYNIKPIGLGARDTLRLEKCFILAGNEFEGGRTPLESTLSWTINWDHNFIGKEALLQQKEKGDYQRLTKLIVKDRGIPRHGCEIQKNGKKVGIVTSGTLSPCLKKGIAMGYVDPEHRNVGDTLDIIIRDKPVEAEIVKPPFVPKDWAKN